MVSHAKTFLLQNILVAKRFVRLYCPSVQDSLFIDGEGGGEVRGDGCPAVLMTRTHRHMAWID